MTSYMETTIKIIIIDTSALISLLIDRDSNHQLAIEMLIEQQNAKAAFIMPGDVYSELINTVGKKFGRDVAIQAADYISKTDFLIVDATDSYDEALLKYRTNTSSPSFTGAIVMAIADKYSTKQIFGFDECFTKGEYQIPTTAEKAA